MPVYRLGTTIAFPDPRDAEPDGLLAVGGDLSPARLLAAYRRGIFPWYGCDPVLWYSPDPRMILFSKDLRVSRSLRSALRSERFTVTVDTAFEAVMRACASVQRGHEAGTWISQGMIQAYTELHRRGFAHSVEAWANGKLAGGLYGISLGAAFFGESMFAYRDDASKVAFVRLVRQLEAWGFHLVDCQVHTGHLARFGAALKSREIFLTLLTEALRVRTRKGPWRFDDDHA
jgi:leucyl/phenylalanyl-tRNA--protein transferase